jgi:3-oxoadipate enol-lactonase
MTPSRSRVVRATDGIALHVEERGTGRPVVLVQGLGYAAWAWEPQARAVGEVANAVVMDNRGTGRSAKPPPPYTIELMADDVAAVVDATGDGPAVIVGASMGGYIAMTLAVRHPEVVRSLVLVSTLTGGPDSVGVPRSTLDAWAANAHLPAPDFARATMPISLGAEWVAAHPERFEELLSARLEYPTPAEAWRAQWDACERFLETGVPPGDIRVPTWIVHGTADQVVPYENAAAIRRRIPQAQLLTLHGCGHLCWLQRPDAVNALLTDVVSAR